MGRSGCSVLVSYGFLKANYMQQNSAYQYIAIKFSLEEKPSIACAPANLLLGIYEIFWQAGRFSSMMRSNKAAALGGGGGATSVRQAIFSRAMGWRCRLSARIPLLPSLFPAFASRWAKRWERRLFLRWGYGMRSANSIPMTRSRGKRLVIFVIIIMLVTISSPSRGSKYLLLANVANQDLCLGVDAASSPLSNKQEDVLFHGVATTRFAGLSMQPRSVLSVRIPHHFSRAIFGIC